VLPATSHIPAERQLTGRGSSNLKKEATTSRGLKQQLQTGTRTASKQGRCNFHIASSSSQQSPNIPRSRSIRQQRAVIF